MVFSRIESVVFYTCTILFVLLLGFIFYRVIVVIWHKLCLLFRGPAVGGQHNHRASQTDRVMELFNQRPQIRDILASRVAESALVTNSGNSAICTNPSVLGDDPSSTGQQLPPAYDSLSLHSLGPPPSYHSQMDTDSITTQSASQNTKKGQEL